jgi:hypothetical protein
LKYHKNASTTASEISSFANDDKNRVIDFDSCPQPGQVFAVVEILRPHSLHFVIAIVSPFNLELRTTLLESNDASTEETDSI